RACKAGSLARPARRFPIMCTPARLASPGATKEKLMKILTASVLLAVLPGGVSLSTQYKADRTLRMEIESSLKMETTTLEIVRDGETQSPNGGMSTETHREEVHVDKVLEVKDGKPTKVERSFEKVGGKSSRTMGDNNSNDTEIESPLDGVTLEI